MRVPQRVLPQEAAMSRLKLALAAALAMLLVTIGGCQPADDSELMSPENDIIVTSPAP